MFGGLLANRAYARASAQPTGADADDDGDGLYNDDESFVYGADPFTYDSDYDGVGDGEEVYNGTDPLAANGGGEVVVPATAPEPAPVPPLDPLPIPIELPIPPIFQL